MKKLYFLLGGIILSISVIINTVCVNANNTDTADIQISAPSAILMEASTGTVIYEKDADTRRSPASITKIMTAILIFDALEEGRIQLKDEVITSAHARSMTGSKVFLEEGEVQTVDTMLKCIMVASGNDASTAMSEHISGSEENFVEKMNNRASGLGMKNTHFVDCCGLSDSDEHYTTARDVAIMARELITKYPRVFEYSKIWMENITHVTKRGSEEFCLSNTNKLLKQYKYATGLKTGSTSKAKYCLCATGENNGISLIAVIMACPDYKARFREAAQLLNYGYGICTMYCDEDEKGPDTVNVEGGAQETVKARLHRKFKCLSMEGENFDNIEKKIILEELKAPVEKNAVIGRIEYSIEGKLLGVNEIFAQNSVRKASYADCFIKLIKHMIGFRED